MPLVYQQNINANTRLGVWHIAEKEDFFSKYVPLHNKITHPHKRLQHLAGRILLTELFENFPVSLIRIADTNKPFLSDETYHFSIAHCGDYAAAIVSKKNRVGVDIEIPHEKIERIRHKFLNQQELEILDSLKLDKHHALTLAWSIKEAMFKWYGAGKVDFKEHLVIEDCIVDDNQFLAHCNFNKEGSIQLKIQGIFFNGNCIAWLAT